MTKTFRYSYRRLLDADAEGADWAEVARIVLHIDPSAEPKQSCTLASNELAL
jgi:hypothetical protein